MNYLFRISGRVQGVGYRVWAAKRMQNMAVRGWVRNIADGRVELYAETDQPEAIKKALYKGPVFASVKRVEVLPTQNSYADRLTQPQEFAILETTSDVCEP